MYNQLNVLCLETQRVESGKTTCESWQKLLASKIAGHWK